VDEEPASFNFEVIRMYFEQYMTDQDVAESKAEIERAIDEVKRSGEGICFKRRLYVAG
jgi:hypothetical protein